MRLFYRITAVGLENIPEGGALIASNHTAFSDVFVISAASKRQVRYMAKSDLFRSPLRPLLKALGAFPIDRSGSDVSGIKKAVTLLKNEKLVGIFPQGHRHGHKDQRYTEVKPGIGMIVYHTGVPVVPVFLDNAGLKTRIFKKNTVIFGKPIYPEELGLGNGGRTEYLNASKYIFRRVCELKYGPSETWEEDPFLPGPAAETADAET